MICASTSASQRLFYAVASIFRVAGLVWVLFHVIRGDCSCDEAIFHTTPLIILDSAVHGVGLVYFCDEGCHLDVARVSVTRSKSLLGVLRYMFLDQEQGYPAQMG